ncbi:hypothetical protein [Paraburkholderia fungorum]
MNTASAAIVTDGFDNTQRQTASALLAVRAKEEGEDQVGAMRGN